MKVAFIFLALVAACSAMSLKQRILNKVENAQIKRAGGEDDGKWVVTVMLEYASLVGKCEAFYYFVSVMTPEEKRSEDKVVLFEMCPYVFHFGQRLLEGDEKQQGEVVMELAGYFQLMQCTNLMAEVQMLKFIGFTAEEDGDKISNLLVHGKTLFGVCEEEFGNVEAEAEKMENALDKSESGNGGSGSGSGDDSIPEKKSEILLNLVRQLKAALRK